MKVLYLFRFLFICIIAVTITGCINNVRPSASQIEQSVSGYLARVMDRFHKTFDVYTDAHAAGNHFPARGRMSSPGDEDAVPPMNEAYEQNPHSGITCIKAIFRSQGSNWGGWYFMNGVLQGKEKKPRQNWGDYPNAGFDMRGTTRLTFWARGERGGERVEFFALGIGRDHHSGDSIKPYPDSSPKVSTGYLTLSTDWQQYSITLKGKDLSYVIGGFGWVTSAFENNNQDITFYIDDIQFDKSRLDEPRLLVSYETIKSTNEFDIIMRNVAFTYDNAVALIGFLASGENKRAKMLADALIYAQQHDRFYEDGRLRNAYQGGDLILFPGWTPNNKTDTARMPGWYDTKHNCDTQEGCREGYWFEDKFQVSTHTGNIAWAMLALLGYHEVNGGGQYLFAVERLGNWVERNSRDTRGAGGYTGGFEGWEPTPARLEYKATEHNIDLYAVFMRLYRITKNETWLERANHAKKFVLAMWDEEEGKFWTGTGDDGVRINKEVIPLDIQAWAILALGEEGRPYWKALEYAESHHKVGDGFDFNQDRDGIWYEGTAQMAVAYYVTGQKEKWQKLISALHRAKFESGGLPAANKDGLTTGFYITDGRPWLYFHRAHVGATAWLVLAEKGINPFWFGSKVK